MWPLRRPRFILILVKKINNHRSITMMKELGHSLIDACYHSTASSHTKQLLEVKITLFFGGDVSQQHPRIFALHCNSTQTSWRQLHAKPRDTTKAQKKHGMIGLGDMHATYSASCAASTTTLKKQSNTSYKKFSPSSAFFRNYQYLQDSGRCWKRMTHVGMMWLWEDTE